MPQPKRDAVHKFYTYEPSSNTSQCSLCGNKIKGKHTSNLKNHMAIKHMKTYSEVVETNKETMLVRQNGNDKPNPLMQQKRLCVRLVAVSGHPLDMINDEAFQNILKLAAPSNARSIEINEDAIKEMIACMATEIKLKIAEAINNKLICLLLSTATYKDRKFLGIFIQYVVYDKIIVRNLLTTEFIKSELGDFLTEKLLEVFKDFQITKEQIYSLTTGCYNYNNGKQMLKDSWEEDNLKIANSIHVDGTEDDEYEVADESEELSHSQQAFIENLFNSDIEYNFRAKETSCAVNILHLHIKDAIEENKNVQEILDLAQKICIILNSATNKNLLKSANLKSSAVDSTTTTWKFAYKMFSQLRKLREFCEGIVDISGTGLVEPEFWDEIDKLLNCLEPFNRICVESQNEQLTVSDFVINWMACKSKLESMRYHFATSLLRSMELREKDLFNTDVVLEALYLDGRLNILLSEEQCERARALIKLTWKKMQSLEENFQDPLDQRCTKSNMFIRTESSRPGPSSGAQSTTLLRSDLSGVEKILMKAEIAKGLATKRTTAFDVVLYELRAAPRLPLDTNILSHWYKNPTNSEVDVVATTVLAMPVTQISSKRMWSSLSFLLSRVRNKLSPNLLQNMLLIRTNKDLLE